MTPNQLIKILEFNFSVVTDLIWCETYKKERQWDREIYHQTLRLRLRHGQIEEQQRRLQ